VSLRVTSLEKGIGGSVVVAGTASGMTISCETGSTGKSWRASSTDSELGGSAMRAAC
jgi:hypothetical protein